jgi:hypothetical protein
VFHGIEKALLFEVEGVIVGQRAPVYASHPENLGGRRVGAKVEDFGSTLPPSLVIGEGALQVGYAQIGGL